MCDGVTLSMNKEWLELQSLSNTEAQTPSFNDRGIDSSIHYLRRRGDNKKVRDNEKLTGEARRLLYRFSGAPRLCSDGGLREDEHNRLFDLLRAVCRSAQVAGVRILHLHIALNLLNLRSFVAGCTKRNAVYRRRSFGAPYAHTTWL